MHSTTALPEEYSEEYSLMLSHNTGLNIKLNLAGAALFIVAGWAFFFMATHISPAFSRGGSVMLNGWIMATSFAVIVGAFVLTGIVHELIHGFFFWIFTRKRPIYGFKGIFAYAAAPDFYIPRNQFLLIGIAPFIVIPLIGSALMLFVPLAAVLTLILILTFNAAGAIGDLYIIGLLLTRPAPTLIRDFGEGMTFYSPA
jgi:hypothetical protein